MDSPFGIGQLLRAIGLLLGAWLGWRYGFASQAGAANFWGNGVQWLAAMGSAIFGAAIGILVGALLFKILKTATGTRNRE